LEELNPKIKVGEEEKEKGEERHLETL